MSDIQQYEPLWGSWYVERLIGEGSFGKVYKIRKEEFGNAYFSAVKIITIPQSEAELRQAQDDGLDDASLRSYFHAQVTDILREIDLMSSLRGNSNIVSFEDHKVIERPGEIAWDILIRMELLTSLRDHFAQKPPTPFEVAKLGIDICKALELCAQRQIIHRDIKPENVFLSDFGEYKLGDFGIARQIERTSSGLSKKGTYTYMAPEVFRGEEYGASVDTYSLGLMMYRLLNANRIPFLPDYPATITPRDRETALQRRMRGEPIPPPRNGNEALQATVLRACAFDRGHRFASAREMRLALTAAVSGNASHQAAPAPVEPPETTDDATEETSATVGVFTNRYAEKPRESGGAKRAKIENDRLLLQKKKRKAGTLRGILFIIATYLVLGLLNMRIVKIELPQGGGTLQAGASITQAYTISPAKPLINDLQWSSSDESVLTVSADGRITAVGPGSATVTLASARGKVSDSVTYRVAQQTDTIADFLSANLLAASSTNQSTRTARPTATRKATAKPTVKPTAKPTAKPGPTYGTLTFSNATYVGEILNGKENGKGKLTWTNGDVYEGYFINGKRTGKGKYTWTNGNVYEGDFIDDVRTGKGRNTWTNGNVYEGDFINDIRTGTGKFFWTDGGVYEGSFLNDKLHGIGKLFWTDGSVYEGEFVDGVRTGHGTFTWGSQTKWAGDVYVGDFLNNERTGWGKYTYKNGKIEEGYFRNNDYIGK